MTATGSAGMWALGEVFGVVPMPPNGELANLLADWWRMPRSFGCNAARSSSWTVVPPSPDIWCPSCATELFDRERRCFYCGGRIRKVNASDALIYEMRGVRLLGRAHAPCSQRAQRHTGGQR